MVILTRKKLAKLEDSYYWRGNRSWTPFPKELKKKLLEMYGEEPLHTHGLNKTSMRELEKS
ncbi:hypothetical protein [Mesobacillus boroniphilus]|uniref:Uncharacterized protein n=1 Tax=Mesobacillus boroniphilus JCM 21738 TaxID=1294265 RepID=W4RX52_9BACI|nr:hypothetical protein [Mesobacillus boroniphilus]GAE48249.1 hypothetical protein JCM21738_5337 [Mesobacillus boroniphilus JCM 21738]